jgi:hypothetical protein
MWFARVHTKIYLRFRLIATTLVSAPLGSSKILRFGSAVGIACCLCLINGSCGSCGSVGVLDTPEKRKTFEPLATAKIYFSEPWAD